MLHGRVRHSDAIGDTHLYGQTAAKVHERRQRDEANHEPTDGAK
jgi:hypothetical protein